VDIEFTPQEISELTAAIREAAAAFVKAWDVLTNIGKRINRDWEPETGNSVCEIAERIACDMRHLDEITVERVKPLFNRPEDWLC
jgi:hypothetical protein